MEWFATEVQLLHDRAYREPFNPRDLGLTLGVILGNKDSQLHPEPQVMVLWKF